MTRKHEKYVAVQIKLNKKILIVIIGILIMSFMGCKAKVREEVKTFKNPIVKQKLFHFLLLKSLAVV